MTNPYRSPQPPSLTLPRQPTRRPSSYYRLWLVMAMLISLAQLRFRGVFEVMEIELPLATQWAMQPMLPLMVLFTGIVLAQVSRHVAQERNAWLGWISAVLVGALCGAFALSLYMPWLSIQSTLE